MLLKEVREPRCSVLNDLDIMVRYQVLFGNLDFGIVFCLFKCKKNENRKGNLPKGQQPDQTAKKQHNANDRSSIQRDPATGTGLKLSLKQVIVVQRKWMSHFTQKHI